MNSPAPENRSASVPRRPRWWPWHQRMGISFAVVFLVVIFTGIALNHTGGLRLDQRGIRADWLYDWYGIKVAGEPISFTVANDWVVAWDGRLAWNDRLLGEASTLRGAVRIGDEQVLVLTDELWVLTIDGEVVERLNSAALPAGEPLRLAARSEDNPIVIETTEGIFVSGADLLKWSPVAERSALVWSEAGVAPERTLARMRRVLRGEDLTLYRIMLDLHSGRFFGRAGVWIVDASALALAFLTISGTWYALRIKRRS